MALLGLFGAKKTKENILVLHGSSASVGGAYVEINDGAQTIVHYARRLPVEKRSGEATGNAFERALRDLCALLAKEGGPALLRGTGSGRASRAVVLIGSPWEKTTVHTESIEPGKEFTVSHATEARALALAAEKGGVGKAEILATYLNGYETKSARGKRAMRAQFVILSSTIDAAIAGLVPRALRSALHQHDVTVEAFTPAAGKGLRALYPHERDYFLVSAAGDSTSVALIENGALAETRDITHGTNELLAAAQSAGIAAAKGAASGLIDSNRNARFDSAVAAVRKSWQDGLAEAFKSFGESHVTPRTIFLLAEDNARGFLKESFTGDGVKSLWMAGEPPRVIALAPQSVNGVMLRTDAEPDLALMIALRGLPETGA